MKHAFRAGRSTESALYYLTSLIDDSLENKEVALCAFLDIEGYFDNTPHETRLCSRQNKTSRNNFGGRSDIGQHFGCP